MTTDHDFDGLYDLRDLQDSDAWFTDAAARSLGTSDPLSPSVIAMLDRLDRELASLAPLDRGTVTALITGLNEPPVEIRAPRRSPRRGAARHARRNLVVVGVTGALLVAAAGVAAASPGSFFYPVREATLGSAEEHSVPEDLSDVESELNRIEVRIAEAQQAGGISEAARTALARRMGVIHPIVERASGDRADVLRQRWTRDDLVLIALPHLVVATPTVPVTGAPTTAPRAPSAPGAPTAPAADPSTTPSASHDGGSGQSSPRAHATPNPQSSHSDDPKGHESQAPTPKPSPSASHHDGDHHPTSTPTPEHTRTPKPTPTPTGGSGTGSGSGQHKDD